MLSELEKYLKNADVNDHASLEKLYRELGRNGFGGVGSVFFAYRYGWDFSYFGVLVRIDRDSVIWDLVDNVRNLLSVGGPLGFPHFTGRLVAVYHSSCPHCSHESINLHDFLAIKDFFCHTEPPSINLIRERRVDWENMLTPHQVREDLIKIAGVPLMKWLLAMWQEKYGDMGIYKLLDRAVNGMDTGDQSIALEYG